MVKNRSRSRDLNDVVERGLWGQLAYVDGSGAIVSVRGTGTLDEEVPIMNTGYGFNIPANSNAEVTMISMGSDVNDKFALPQIPRDRQHQWAEGTGGVQHPMNPDNRLQFDGDGVWLTDGNYRFGPNGEYKISISDGEATLSVASLKLDTDVRITGGLVVEGDIRATGGMNVTGGLGVTGELVNNGVNVGSTHTHSGVDRGGENTDGPH